MSQGEDLCRSRAYSQPSIKSQESALPFCITDRRVTRSATKAWSELVGSLDLATPNSCTKMSDPKMDFENYKGNPEDITPATWFGMFSSLNTTLKSLKDKINDLKEVKTHTSVYMTEWKESVDTDLITNESKLKNHQFKINLLTNMLINQEE